MANYILSINKTLFTDKRFVLNYIPHQNCFKVYDIFGEKTVLVFVLQKYGQFETTTSIALEPYFNFESEPRGDYFLKYYYHRLSTNVLRDFMSFSIAAQ